MKKIFYFILLIGYIVVTPMIMNAQKISNIKSKKDTLAVDTAANQILFSNTQTQALLTDTVVWTAMTSPTTVELHDIWGFTDSCIYIVGSTGKILTYNGVLWSTLNSGVTNDLWGAWGTSQQNMYFVGYNGKILRYNGTTVTAMTSPVTTTLWRVWGSEPDNIYAVGDNGKIIRYNGTSWSVVNHNLTTVSLRGIWGRSSNDIYVVGSAGTVLHYDGTWHKETVTGLGTRDVRGVGGNSSTVYITAAYGYIYKFENNTWTSSVVGSNTCYDLWGTYNEQYAVGTVNGTTLHLENGTWSSELSGTTNNLFGVWGSDLSTGYVYAVGSNGTIIRRPRTLNQVLTLKSGMNNGYETNHSNSEILPSINVYPNPNNGQFEIALNQSTQTGLTVQILSLTGSSVYKETFSDVPTVFRHSVTLGATVKGLYLVQITGTEGDIIFMEKVVVE